MVQLRPRKSLRQAEQRGEWGRWRQPTSSGSKEQRQPWQCQGGAEGPASERREAIDPLSISTLTNIWLGLRASRRGGGGCRESRAPHTRGQRILNKVTGIWLTQTRTNRVDKQEHHLADSKRRGVGNSLG